VPELNALEARVIACRRCPRLVAWREQVAREKRASFRDDDYWGRPVPGFGDPDARLLIVGLAPAAHGANRTGRMFTGDRSGDWLFRALHRAGFASQPQSIAPGDGLTLDGAWLTAGVRCAPPGNRPTPDERSRCRPWLEAEFDHFLPRLRCIVVLGGFAFDQVLRVLRDRGFGVPSPKPTFGHAAEVMIPRAEGEPNGAFHLLASYHPSQQNTFTGTLTEPAFDRVWARARELCNDPPPDRLTECVTR
jgi:uracil-DNA glycosylase